MESTPALLCSVKEGARLLGISFWTLYRASEMNVIPTVKVGRRRLISRASIEKIARDGLPSLTRIEPTERSETAQAA